MVDAEVSPDDQATLTARYTARAVDFLERAGSAADGRPFFLYLAHSMPHVPLFVGREFRGTSPDGLYGDVLAEIDASVAALLAALDRTGHAESVLVRFDPDRISYATLLRAFWRNVDPLDGEGQFCDRGSSYRPVIFTGSADQLEQASESERLARQELGTSGALAVAIEPLKRFWRAEDYHQDYAERQALTYNFYRWRCGRDARLDAVWGEQARLPVVWKTATAFPTNAG
ncbi:MAG: peptide-methionine (S)-S-oxide reductase [Synechococcus sp.]|nr:peptide-methionine (S)-S-oxide reductase [Synechococcus sp.]